MAELVSISATVRRTLLIDVDSCFAACERIFHPELRGRPIVVLSNNDGCVIARSREAKRLGVAMGTPWFEIKELAEAKGIVAKSSNYELYGSISGRIMDTLREFCARVDVYSIDEAFCTLSGTPHSIISVARKIRETIAQTIGIPVSIGIAPTKTLAKIASKSAKNIPFLEGVASFDGLSRAQMDTILSNVPVDDLWGVGRKWGARLRTLGIDNARQLRDLPPEIMRKKFNVNMARMILELRGSPCIEIDDRDATRQGQVMFSRSFSSPIQTMRELEQVLSIYSQKVTTRLRRQGLDAGSVWAFASSAWYKEPFVRIQAGCDLSVRTDSPVEVYRAARSLLFPRYKPGIPLVRAGVALYDIRPRGSVPVLDPFQATQASQHLGKIIDDVNHHVGEGSVGLGLGGMKQPPRWQMKREMLSNRATTHWEELAIVKA